MKATPLSVDDALKQGQKSRWAMLRCFSEFSLGPTPETLPNATELIEARFFDEDGEIRIFPADNELKAVLMEPEAGDLTVDERFTLDNSGFGKILREKKYLTFDEDGQCCVDTVCLSGWEG